MSDAGPEEVEESPRGTHVRARRAVQRVTRLMRGLANPVPGEFLGAASTESHLRFVANGYYYRSCVAFQFARDAGFFPPLRALMLGQGADAPVQGRANVLGVIS